MLSSAFQSSIARLEGNFILSVASIIYLPKYLAAEWENLEIIILSLLD